MTTPKCVQLSDLWIGEPRVLIMEAVLKIRRLHQKACDASGRTVVVGPQLASGGEVSTYLLAELDNSVFPARHCD